MPKFYNHCFGSRFHIDLKQTVKNVSTSMIEHMCKWYRSGSIF